MRKKMPSIHSGFVGLIFFLFFALSVNNTAFSQTTPEEAVELWNLRQTEIQQFYQEGNLEGALNSAQEAVSLAETAFGSGSLETISSLCCRRKSILKWTNWKRLIRFIR